MAKNRTDDGSNSDSSSGSLKEITADDFKQPDARVSSRSRGWMSDLMSYPVRRSYSQDLYSFAWAQAVQNKPLGFDVNPNKDEDDDDEIQMLIEDNEADGEGEGETEKEEGELEEGEIEFGAELELVNEESNGEKNGEKNEMEPGFEETVEEIDEFDKRFGVILEELETITLEVAESSFDEACLRLQKSFASLKQMFSEGHGQVLEVLVDQAFTGIQTVYSAFKSGNLKAMDQNKELLLRLLIHIKNQYSTFLTSEQVKEIDIYVHALASEAISVGKTADNVSGSATIAERTGMSYAIPRLDSGGSNFVDGNRGMPSLPKLEPLTNSRSRVESSPLLNLHADYDEDSLPSPTRDNAPLLPVLKPIGFGTGAAVCTQQMIVPRNAGAGNGTLHPYVTDAFKAVSSYQQKYGKNSVVATNLLPSPTPSEDGNDGNDDVHGEVSSSSAAANFRTVVPSSVAANANSSGRFQMAPVDSSAGFPMGLVSSSGGPQRVPAKTAGQVGLEPNLVVKASAKSRDPRLRRFMNSEAGNTLQNGVAAGPANSRKHKAVDGFVPDEHNLKRQRYGPTSSGDVPVTAVIGGWIEDTGMITSQANNMAVGNRGISAGEVCPSRRLNANGIFNGLNVASVPNMSTSASPVVSAPNMSTDTAPVISLPSLLNDFAVNPTLLMQLLVEQQRIAGEAQQKAAGPAVNGLSSAVSSVSEVGQNPVAKPPTPPRSTPLNPHNDMGKVRMKPRDPRRILHSNMVQKSESPGSEPIKASGRLSSDVLASKDNATVRGQGEQAQMIYLPSQSSALPDISRQFTKNLQNLADIVSNSQAQVPSPGVTQSASQPISSIVSNNSTEQKNVPGLSSEGGTMNGPAQLANPWGDVDHLLEGYDDHQKATIQKERARRIAEQNKMFAARKLCLVLDLDHTLLNSAKFVEIDPVHEEILKKKEEQDRQKQERHIYHFPHMGMWTKLRPGIWNFLEKASQLYELHLYTMGNKLYATEMAKILDPKGTLFYGRVISKGDDADPCDGDERVPKSKDLDGVLGMESAVVIIDDSVRVWPHNKLNLIVVERYTYFPSSRRQFGLLGPSLLEIDHDERPEEGTLALSLAVIERIHQLFFSHHSLNEIDVRNILAAEQRKILAGCRIVFSRVFPVGEANPHLHPLWQTAEQFGAECTNQLDERVTHVVANSRGTDKVNWALSTGKFVVYPGWVEASALLYRRANEKGFAV